MRALGKEASGRSNNDECIDAAERLWNSIWASATKEQQPPKEIFAWEISKMSSIGLLGCLLKGLRSDLEALSERVDRLADRLEGGKP